MLLDSLGGQAKCLLAKSYGTDRGFVVGVTFQDLPAPSTTFQDLPYGFREEFNAKVQRWKGC
jgi:hypothetical protein